MVGTEAADEAVARTGAADEVAATVDDEEPVDSRHWE